MTDRSKRSILPQAAGRGQAGERLHRPATAAGYMLAAAAAFAGLGAAVKVAAVHLSPEVIVFVRSVVGLALSLPWLLRHGLGGLSTRRPWGHLARGLFGVGAMYTFFYAIDHLTLAEAVLLSYTTPLFLPLFAWLWLREPVGGRLVLAVVVGFVGVYGLLDPQGTGWRPAAWVGLASGALAALAMVAVRALSDSEPPWRVVFYFALVSTVVSAPAAWWWQGQWAGSAVLWAVVAGVLATAGQYGVTQAYRHAPAAVVAPFSYATVLFALMLGWLLWHELPPVTAWVGGALVVAAGILALRR